MASPEGGEETTWPTEDQDKSIPQQPHYVSLTAEEIESLMKQPVLSDEVSLGGPSWSNNSINLSSGQYPLQMMQHQSFEVQTADALSEGSSEHICPVNNQMAAGTEQVRQQQSVQRQPANNSNIGTHSRGNIPQIAALEEEQLPRKRMTKREADREYRKRNKEKQQKMESDLKTFEAEIKLLKARLVLVNQRFETKSKEVDELRNKYGTLKTKYNEECENKRQLEADLKMEKAERIKWEGKYIEFLEKRVQSFEHGATSMGTSTTSAVTQGPE